MLPRCNKQAKERDNWEWESWDTTAGRSQLGTSTAETGHKQAGMENVEPAGKVEVSRQKRSDWRQTAQNQLPHTGCPQPPFHVTHQNSGFRIYLLVTHSKKIILHLNPGHTHTYTPGLASWPSCATAQGSVLKRAPLLVISLLSPSWNYQKILTRDPTFSFCPGSHKLLCWSWYTQIQNLTKKVSWKNIYLTTCYIL